MRFVKQTRNGPGGPFLVFVHTILWGPHSYGKAQRETTLAKALRLSDSCLKSEHLSESRR